MLLAFCCLSIFAHYTLLLTLPTLIKELQGCVAGNTSSLNQRTTRTTHPNVYNHCDITELHDLTCLFVQHHPLIIILSVYQSSCIYKAHFYTYKSNALGNRITYRISTYLKWSEVESSGHSFRLAVATRVCFDIKGYRCHESLSRLLDLRLLFLSTSTT